MNHHDDNSVFDDSLDRAIHEALRVEPGEHEVEHLEQYWHAEVRREKWRRNALQLCTAAAATIAIAVAALLVRSREHEPDVAQAPSKPPEKIVVTDPVAPPNTAEASQDNDNSQAPKPSLSAGRPATAYEQLMFASRSRTDVRPAAAEAAVDSALHRMITSAGDDPQQVFLSANVKPAVAENLLLRRLPNAQVRERQAIVNLLAVCGSRRSVPALLRVYEKQGASPEALAAIEKIVGIDGLVQVVQTSLSAKVRVGLTRHLLTTESPDRLVGFLSLVRNEATRAEALAVAKVTPEIPLSELIALLDHKDGPVRQSAAMTLGYVNGPKTTQMLIARVTERPANSPEAWIALMSCRGDTARDFLAYATQRPQLLGYYNNARVHWAQMIP